MVTPTFLSTRSAVPVFQGQRAVRLAWRRIAISRRLMLALPWIGFALQGPMAQSSDDLTCALLAASGAFLLVFDAFRPRRFYRYPLSTLVLLGFAVTLQLGPLLFTVIEGHSITYNLAVPIDTFGHGVLTSLVCVLAHAIYRQLPWFQQGRAAAQRLLFRLNLFQPLRFVEVIAMGVLGVFALVLDSSVSTALVKVFQGFQFFSVIPAAFLLQEWIRTERSKSQHSRRALVLFLLFMALIIFASMVRNSRGSFVLPLSCLFLGLALEWLFGRIRIRLISVVSVVLVIVLILPLLADVATAMVMVRGQRTSLSASEIVNQTLYQLLDREAIQSFRSNTSELGLTDDWNENYVSNVFLARFANAKFPDNSLENAKHLSPADRDEMAVYQWIRLVTIMPGPLLWLFGVSAATKQEVNGVSFGDKLYALASGSRYALGGFRTGHFFGTGMAGFGISYLLMFLVALLLFFLLVDAHALVAATGCLAPPLLSVVAITQLTNWFTVSNSESLVLLLAFALRGFIEPVFLFALVRWLLAPVRFAE